MDWDECKAALYVDGSLRDIYVHNTTAADWERLLTYTSSLKTSYFHDGEPAQMPTQVTEIFEERDAASFLLVIEAGKVKLNCHFLLGLKFTMVCTSTKVGRKFDSVSLLFTKRELSR